MRCAAAADRRQLRPQREQLPQQHRLPLPQLCVLLLHQHMTLFGKGTPGLHIDYEAARSRYGTFAAAGRNAQSSNCTESSVCKPTLAALPWPHLYGLYAPCVRSNGCVVQAHCLERIADAADGVRCCWGGHMRIIYLGRDGRG